MSITSRTLTKQTLHQARSFTLTRETIELSNGATITKDIVRHPGAVVILPLLDTNRFLVIKQFRAALGREILEFPAGTMEVGELPQACAAREIVEETDHAAATWVDLGILFPAPGFCDEKQFGYLAKDLSPRPGEKDEDEIIEVMELSFPEIDQKIANGDICDAKSIAFYYRAKLAGLIG